NSKNNNQKYWKKLLFTDLHVSSKSLDRTLNVLKKVRELSCTELLDNKPTPVVFLGDFWHQRDVLHVRHIDHLLKEFESWKQSDIETILIPGNHDQVSIDGTVHGIQLFSLFPNFTVATDPIIDKENGLAYLPWRETKEDQTMLFHNLSKQLPNPESSIHSKWTVFAHAEAKGAVANGGYRSTGKFDLDGDTSFIRSCYLGHYHKRQQISKNYWYIGSPYEQNYGEMNEPHGVAFVDSNRIQPYFVDFDDLPKHHKLIFPFDTSKLNLIKSNDFVEIKATKEMMRSKEFVETIDMLPKSIDLRRVLINDTQFCINQNETVQGNNEAIKETTQKDETTKNKFKLDDFLETYIKKNEGNGLDKNELLYLGKNILSSVKEPTIVPLGRKVQIQNIKVNNFCGISNELELNLKDEEMLNKMILIRGQMGTGKSTIFEALVWCLYGNTSPKKQSTSSSSIKGDEVINDSSNSTSVTVEVLVDSKLYQIKRTKKRGSGAKISINGLEDQQIKQGVMDQQNLINNIIGLDYESFRMSIYLGQGSISNFVTDSDKRKKELLSRIFSLGLCIPANKIAKELRKKKEIEINELQKSLYSFESSLKTWRSIDYLKQSNEWEESKISNINNLINEIKIEKEKLEKLSNNQISYNSNNNEQPIKMDLLKNSKEIKEFLNSLEFKKEQFFKEFNESSNKTNKKLNENKFKLSQLEVNIKQNNAELKYWLDYIDKQKCNQCGQNIPDDLLESNRKDADTKILKFKESIEKQQHQIFDIEHENDELVDKLKEIEKEFEINKKLNQLEIQTNQITLQEITKQLEELSKNEININFLKQSISDKESRLSQLENNKDPFKEKVDEKELNINSLTTEVQSLNDKLKEAEIKFKELEFWEDGFNSNGLPMLALQSVVKEVESYANEYLSKLSKGQLFTSLSIQDDELSIDIFELDPETKLAKPRSFNQLSGGQRRCLELSYSPFALSEVIYNHSGSRVTFMAIDELTNHLDSSVKPIICDLMRNLQEKDSIFVIDHDVSVQSEFDHVFNLTKENNKLKLNLL
ncbi:hypothetical protein DICPUDRAFT_15107, partial [Dictyostelium purpureum]